MKAENGFTYLIHRLDGVLEAAGRLDGPQLTITVDEHPDAVRDRLARDASNKGPVMRSFGADANFGRLARHTKSTNIDIVAPRREIGTRVSA